MTLGHLAETLTLPTTTIENTPSPADPEQGNQNPDATDNPETPETETPDIETSDTTDSGCGATHPMVGFTTQLSNRAHSVSGTATIIDNCTIEVTNFTYDGGGLPGVIFYGSVDGNYFSSGFPIGENIFGRTFNNETFTITLDAPSELNRLNGISVWCVRAGVSFGDGIFSSP